LDDFWILRKYKRNAIWPKNVNSKQTGRTLKCLSKVSWSHIVIMDMLDRYGISVSQMTTDMFHLSQALPGAFLIHDLSHNNIIHQNKWREIKFSLKLSINFPLKSERCMESLKSKFDHHNLCLYIWQSFLWVRVVLSLRRVLLVEHELITLQEHLSSPPIINRSVLLDL
jgi:hypothetical protein